MIKRTCRWLGLLAVLTAMTGCGLPGIKVKSDYKDVDRYTRYLKIADGSVDELSISSEMDDGGEVCYIWVDNTSDEHFTVCTVSIYLTETSEETLGTSTTCLMRPGSYSLNAVRSKTSDLYYVVDVAMYYTFTMEAPLDYRYIEDHDLDTGKPYIDILTDGTYAVSDIEAIARREYAIAVLTNYMDTDYYYFDAGVSYLADYPDYPDPLSAVYHVTADYDAKTLTIQSPSSSQPVTTLSMD